MILSKKLCDDNNNKPGICCNYRNYWSCPATAISTSTTNATVSAAAIATNIA